MVAPLQSVDEDANHLVWKHCTFSENNKFKATVGIWKVTVTVSWNICKFILIYFMLCDLMVTAFVYHLI